MSTDKGTAQGAATDQGQSKAGAALDSSGAPGSDDSETSQTLTAESLGGDAAGVEGREDGDSDLPVEREALAAALVAARQEAKTNKENVLRGQAELENLRKRAQRDVENAHKFGLEKFLEELFPIRDSMELGLAATAEQGAQVEQLAEGIDLTLKMLSGAMEKFGVEVVDPAGAQFDPEFHQAMSMQEVPEVESGTVTMVMQKGFVLNGRLVRPALVMVAK